MQKIKEVRKLRGSFYESVGRKFESCRAHQLNQGVTDFGLWPFLIFYNPFLTRIVKPRGVE